jgi:alkylhydroperoxidase/carboxymuconolactone decarboxylase family protein YurZ
MTEPISPEQAQRQLDELKAKRGYLLPHHGLLALTAPKLLAAYDATYTALTLEQRQLSRRDKETIWIAILVTMKEHIATHHIRLLREAGGTEGDFAAAIRLAGFARGVPAFQFVAESWHAHLPDFRREQAYRAALTALCADLAIRPGLVEMLLGAVHTCLFQHVELAAHIRQAYALGVPELELAEALSLTMFPGSVPAFVDACGVWQGLVARGEVPASPALRAWAAASGTPPAGP